MKFRIVAMVKCLAVEFKELCLLCEELAKISSRISKIDLVASFLNKLSSDEIAPAVRMIIGNVFPAWDQREFEVSGTTLFRVLRNLTGVTPREYLEFFNRTGDVGSCFKAVLEVKRKPLQKLLFEKPLTILEVYRILNEIAKATGVGSRKKKERLLESLLSRASPLESKYIVKLIIGERRHGFGEGLMEEAIAKAFNVPSELVRRANMLISDIGHVAEKARLHGISGVKDIGIVVFHPIKPMLAEDVKHVEDALLEFGGVAAFEIKPDGARVQIHRKGDRVEIYSRRLTNVTRSLPEVVETIRNDISARELIVEGEVIAVGLDGRPLPFQYVMRRFRRIKGIKEMMSEIPVKLYLFDVLYVDGLCLIDKPYYERRNILESLAPKSLLINQIVTREVDVAKRFFESAIENGHEGVVAKNLNAPYTPGIRGKKWLKIKAKPETLDLIVVAAEYGYGYRYKWLSDYYLAARDKETGELLVIGKCFTGLSDEEIKWMTEQLERIAIMKRGRTVIVQPKIVVEVAFSEIQKSPHYESGFALRFARITRIRTDKSPEEADTIQRVQQIFEEQFKRKSKKSSLP